jgi:hypothetical protein
MLNNTGCVTNCSRCAQDVEQCCDFLDVDVVLRVTARFEFGNKLFCDE